ncbi:MAG: hypothetical protein JWM91_631, partial [Rhodospirillales bacterium]|nr:hypothetical protein [Rhodospirillales bacterium]
MSDFTLNPDSGRSDSSHHGRRSSSIFDRAIIGPAIGHSFRKLDPRTLIRNPV